MDMNRNEATTVHLEPFLKWAGGKRWLVKSSTQIAPHAYKTYIEPFVGSGAVFFYLNPQKSIIADLNLDLVTVFKQLKRDWRSVESYLKQHHRLHSDDHYYKVRSSKPRVEHSKAARFIYLNRTCWNGLYRVNLKGEFNVPRGTKNSVIMPTDNYSAVAKRLRNCKILCQDFSKTISMADKDDFIFIDPPYTVNHNLNGFLKYNEKIFSWSDQLRLKDCIKNAIGRGVKITMTNADHPSIRALYRDIGETEILIRNSKIAGETRHRGLTSEILIRFGWTAS
ncbi:MAG: Dam family site-specific DNA-(adenine-N6)-methyltransferase [Candidatus Thiodiazotropha endolucinida]